MDVQSHKPLIQKDLAFILLKVIIILLSDLCFVSGTMEPTLGGWSLTWSCFLLSPASPGWAPNFSSDLLAPWATLRLLPTPALQLQLFSSQDCDGVAAVRMGWGVLHSTVTLCPWLEVGFRDCHVRFMCHGLSGQDKYHSNTSLAGVSVGASLPFPIHRPNVSWYGYWHLYNCASMVHWYSGVWK